MSSQTSHESDEAEGRDSTAGERSEPDIPEQIRNMMRDDEIENMQSLDGWAVGRVALQETTVNPDSLDREVLDDAWIELFNGEGKAGEFGGLRFMAVDGDGEYREMHAYASRKDLQGNEPGWYVQKFYQPTDPDVGKRYPDGPGVVR